MKNLNITVVFSIRVEDDVVPENVCTEILGNQLAFAEGPGRQIVAKGSEVLQWRTTEVVETPDE